VQKRLMHSLMGNETARGWMADTRWRVVLAAATLLAAALIVFLVVRHWQ
jgi:hypothetical protein